MDEPCQASVQDHKGGAQQQINGEVVDYWELSDGYKGAETWDRVSERSKQCGGAWRQDQGTSLRLQGTVEDKGNCIQRGIGCQHECTAGS